MSSLDLDNNHRAIQAAQGIDPDTPEATRAREIAMFGAQETGTPASDWMIDLAEHLGHEAASGLGDGGMENIRQATQDKRTRQSLGIALRTNRSAKP